MCIHVYLPTHYKISLEILAKLEEDLKVKEIKEVTLETIQTNPIMVEYFKSDKEKSLVS